MQLINNFLNRFSMYKVVSLALTALFLSALTLSLLGTIAYSPLAIIASAAVLGLSVYVASVLFGLLFNVRVHAESSFITGLILFFIFTPTLEPTGLLILGLVGVIAAGSKFVIVYRGRHIFNAAAIAAVIAGLTGLAYATWWVATPPIALITFILGFLIIQKTRRAAMGGTFIGLSAILVIAVLLSYGTSIGDSLPLLLSWPILFFAGFMLTEPLTMPPKRWQQITEAAIVAVLFAVPIHIGEFSTTPAFALIIGNVIAFGFTRRHAVTLKFQQRKQLTPTSYEFIFTPLREVSYQAGQYAELTINHPKSDMRGMRRSFSMTSAPGDKTIRFGVKFYDPSSSFKKTLKTLGKNTVIQSTGINGDFILPANESTPLLYIAGGIGITPFVSHLRYLRRMHQTRDIVLLYAVSSTDEVAYKDILVTAGIKVFVITNNVKRFVVPVGWQIVAEPFVTKELLQKYVPDSARRLAYVSGPPILVDGAKKYLGELGSRHIKTDYFIGY